MRGHHPLGSAHRARGIDQVSGTVRVGGNARPPGYGLDVLGEAHQLHVGGETVGQRREVTTMAGRASRRISPSRPGGVAGSSGR